jgi:hypothetical protein
MVHIVYQLFGQILRQKYGYFQQIRMNDKTKAGISVHIPVGEIENSYKNVFCCEPLAQSAFLLGLQSSLIDEDMLI